MKLKHEAGAEMFIDFTGKRHEITNRQTGELTPVETVDSILPNGQYTYVEATRSQKKEDLIACCENALRFY